MNNRSNGSISFNTIKRSHRRERLQRRRQGRIVLLAICAVLLLLALTGMIFLIVHIAHIASDKPPIPDGNDPPSVGAPVSGYVPQSYTYADTQTGDLILVNKSNQYSFPVTRLENMDAATQANYNLNTYHQQNPAAYRVSTKFATPYMQPNAAQALHQMLSDYYAYTGDGSLWVYETYRTFDAQKNKDFPQGYSDHHTGLLVRLTSDNEATAIKADHLNHKWIFDNCHKYGFVQRFPAGKAGLTGDTQNYLEAFRYVGVAHATYMKANNLCLEEYLLLLKRNHISQSGTDGKHLTVDANGDGIADYEIYYTPANNAPNAVTAVYVPTDYKVTVSGDNCGGFVITVDLNTPSKAAS